MFSYPVNVINITGLYTNSHFGLDLGWWDNYNPDIFSIGSGKVIDLENDYNTTDTEGNSYGNYVLIEHKNGMRSMYAHLKYQSVIVNIGDEVLPRQKIANMGNTGYSSGTHLHIEIRIGNTKLNPSDYLYCYPYQTVRENNYSYTVKYLPNINTHKNFNFLLFGRKFKYGSYRIY